MQHEEMLPSAQPSVGGREYGARNKKIILISSLAFLAIMVTVCAVLFTQGNKAPTDRELADAYYEAHKNEFYVPTGFEGEDTAYISGAYPYDHRIIVAHGPMEEEYSDALLGEMPALSVIFRLLDAAKAGDSAAYNACFTDEYRRVNGDFAPFTPQKLYGIRITKESAAPAGSEVYSVAYCIKDNDGSLRRDMVVGPRDMVLTIVKNGESYCIAGTSLRFSVQAK